MQLQTPVPADPQDPTVRAVVGRLSQVFPQATADRVVASATYAWRAVAFVAEELLSDVRLVELIARADLESRLSGRESAARVFGVHQPGRRQRVSA